MLLASPGRMIRSPCFYQPAHDGPASVSAAEFLLDSSQGGLLTIVSWVVRRESLLVLVAEAAG